MGDLNAGEDSEPLSVLRRAGLRDSYRERYPSETDVQTVHHYIEPTGDKKIDYIGRCPVGRSRCGDPS